MPMLKTDDMRERLERGGFTDQKADALMAVIEELAEVFVTKDYLHAELSKLRAQLWKVALSVVGILTAIMWGLLELYL